MSINNVTEHDRVHDSLQIALDNGCVFQSSDSWETTTPHIVFERSIRAKGEILRICKWIYSELDISSGEIGRELT